MIDVPENQTKPKGAKETLIKNNFLFKQSYKDFHSVRP